MFAMIRTGRKRALLGNNRTYGVRRGGTPGLNSHIICSLKMRAVENQYPGHQVRNTQESPLDQTGVAVLNYLCLGFKIAFLYLDMDCNF